MEFKLTNAQAYKDSEKIVGKDPWYQVLWYRFILLLTDVISIAFMFAVQMTIIFYKFMKILIILMRDGKDHSVVLTSYMALGMMIFATFTFAWVYFAARKYAGPIAEALAHRISGEKDDSAPKVINAPVQKNTEGEEK